jgi:predicted DNA-binding protein (UPF0251 family)
MAKPRKCRHINFLPDARYFKPQGIATCDLEEVSFLFEEIEAIRLKDIEGLIQTRSCSFPNEGNNEY